MRFNKRSANQSETPRRNSPAVCRLRLQGTGRRKKLLQLSIDIAFSNEQTEQMVLSVAHANEDAIGLYQRFGFAEYGGLENFFKACTGYLGQSFFI